MTDLYAAALESLEKMYHFMPEEEYQAISSALKNSMWQPISTAPRDGTTVDLYGSGGRYTNMKFGHNQWRDSITYDIWDDEYTHFMPLPAAPPEVGS